MTDTTTVSNTGFTTSMFSATTTLAPETTAEKTCENCGRTFTPRKGSGGKPQKFCTPECKDAFHAGKPNVAQRGGSHVGVNAEAAIREPTPHERRSMLVAGADDFHKHFPRETPEELVDRMLAEQKVSLTLPKDDSDDFDWGNDISVICHEQKATAIYTNKYNQIVIRQERSWNEEDDPFVVISREQLQAVIDTLCDLAGIPSIGK